MKHIILSIAIILLSFYGFSQSCLSGETVFTTQQEVDDFLINYPNCVEIDGVIRFEGESITNFNAFKNIERINTLVVGKTNMGNLMGFNKLKFVNELRIDGNDFTYFGFYTLDSIQSFYLENCPNIKYIGAGDSEIGVKYMKIKNNLSLESFLGIDTRRQLYDLHIESNPKLRNINIVGDWKKILIKNNQAIQEISISSSSKTDLQISISNNNNLQSIDINEDLDLALISVFENPNLNTCETLCSLAKEADDFIVYDNGPQCSIEEFNCIGIESNCSTLNDVFRTQQNVDDFLTTNPNCKNVDEINISSDEIFNFNGFKNIKHIGSLNVGNSKFKDFSGFENLKSLGSLNVYKNNFESYHGLEHLESIGNLFINNSAFESYHGLENVDTIDILYVNTCDSIKNFEGLGNIDQCYKVTVVNNIALESFSGMNLSTVKNIKVENNSKLLDFSINFKSNIDGEINILNNEMLRKIRLGDSVNLLNSLIIRDNPYLSIFEADPNLIIDRLEIVTNLNLNTCDNLCPIAQKMGSYEIHTNGQNCNIDDSSCSGFENNCLSGGKTFTNQLEVDRFIINHPNCKYIPNSIYIKGKGISNYSAFKNLETIEKLHIESTSCKNFVGFTNLRFHFSKRNF